MTTNTAAPVAELILSPDSSLRPTDIEAVAVSERRVAVSEATIEALKASANTLEVVRKRGDLIYGLTTGFGPLAGESIDGADIELLQKNLVYHLASGTGSPFRKSWARAMMLCRAASLCRGHSAIQQETLDLLLTWLNESLTPAIPRFGTVGASGDLTPLAHLALAMMGQGEVLIDGQRQPASDELKRRGIAVVELRDRDGLALVNGTAAMTGLAALAQQRGRRALRCAVALGAAFAECMGAHAEAFDPFLAHVRPHRGQRRVCRALQNRFAGSQRLQDRGAVHNLFTNDRPSLPQDAYTLRCIPQMLGAVDDMIVHHDSIVTTEINSVTDNPVIDVDQNRVIHGGNFFGHHIALASDSFNQSVTTIAVLAERQIARITDPQRSPYPAFLQPNRTGLQSGLMGAQVTASSLVARLRSLCVPLSIQSMPTNGGNQDVNPMGTLAALRSHEILDRVFEVLAILSLCIAQAHHLQHALYGDKTGFSTATEELVKTLRDIVAPIIEDRPLSMEIEAVAELLDTPGQRL